MKIRKSRILKANKQEMGSLRSVIRHNTRRRFSESVMKAGRSHRRRTFGVPYPEEKVNKYGPRKELK